MTTDPVSPASIPAIQVRKGSGRRLIADSVLPVTPHKPQRTCHKATLRSHGVELVKVFSQVAPVFSSFIPKYARAEHQGQDPRNV